jgi:hypothetical protein
VSSWKGTASFGLTWRWGLLVSVAFLVLHLPRVAEKYEPNTWLERDGSFYFTTLRAMADHGRIEQRFLQPQSWYAQKLSWNSRLPDDWSNVAQGVRGWYPKHSILLPLLSIPLYLLLGVFGTLVMNVGLNLVFVLLVFLVCRRVARIEIAAFVAIVTASLPFVRLMSYGYSNDLLGADLALGAMEAVLGGWFGLAGLLAGGAIWSRVTNGSILPGLILVGWSVGGRKGVGRAVLFSILPLGLFAAYNTWAFGAPWSTSYQNVIVRENGVQLVASHVKAFNTTWAKGLQRLLLDGYEWGIFASFPILAPGLLGLALTARKSRLIAVGFFLFILLPCLSVTTYDWYRPHFLFASFGVGALGLAAGLAALLPAEEPLPEPAPLSPRVRLALSVAGVILLLACAGWRFATYPNPRLLSNHVQDAHVWLGDVPCDYWNPQRDRWECSHLDPELWAMTGRILGPPVMIQHEPHKGIWLHPSPTRKWRRVVFDQLDAKSVELSVGLGDDGRNGTVQVEILPRGGETQRLDVAIATLEHRTVAIAPGDGPALEIRVRADEPNWKPLVVEGVLQP